MSEKTGMNAPQKGPTVLEGFLWDLLLGTPVDPLPAALAPNLLLDLPESARGLLSLGAPEFSTADSAPAPGLELSTADSAPG